MPGLPAAFEFASILGVLISVLISLFLAALVVVAALSLRSQNSMGHSLVDHPIKEKSNINLHLEDLYEKDDKNPDVIPCPKGKTQFYLIKYDAYVLITCTKILEAYLKIVVMVIERMRKI